MVIDTKAARVLSALKNGCKRRRWIRDTDLCHFAQLSKGVVRRRLSVLQQAGLIEEYWLGDSKGPFYRPLEVVTEDVEL